jgi:hypothetical protein
MVLRQRQRRRNAYAMGNLMSCIMVVEKADFHRDAVH